MFAKVLVANRGEIAVRVIRALRELGIASVAVYSEPDRTSPHVRLADEAVAIGPAPAAESYLNIPRILEAARATGAGAIHPGYGFLSENAVFATACEEADLVFIGPPAEAIRRMGSKTEARALASRAGVAVVPGTAEAAATLDQARDAARLAGYPVMLKASAGGGGKGMRVVRHEHDLAAAFRDASSESAGAFGDGTLYVEKRLDNPRHIEIQVFGDRRGGLIHLGERECSIQRRHQKLIEECPSPLVAAHPRLREELGEAAVEVARAAGYVNAGTVEFLVDSTGRYYFLEMNTRLQVEHPVTELVTGQDLVHWQLRVASGLPLPLDQRDVTWRGAAIECRVYAEDPENHFFPCPGLIRRLKEPAGPGVRLDSGVAAGWNVPLDYDPLLAKLAVWGEDRGQAIGRLARALAEYDIAGIWTNLSFFSEVVADSEFRAGRLHTGFVEEFFRRRDVAASGVDGAVDVALVVAALDAIARKTNGVLAVTTGPPPSHWRQDGRARQLR